MILMSSKIILNALQKKKIANINYEEKVKAKSIIYDQGKMRVKRIFSSFHT